jgi:Trypsin-like peptidase domain
VTASYNPHNILQSVSDCPDSEFLAWGHPIGRSVYPLFIRENDRLFFIGTAFLISRFGFILTAAHCIFDGIYREPHLAHLRNDFETQGSFDLNQIGFSVLVHYPISTNSIRSHLLPLENIGGAPPTDVVIGSIANFFAPLSDAPMILSPSMPQGDTLVTAVGYPKIDVPTGGLDIEEAQANPQAFLKDYDFRIRVSKGTVKAIFASHFAKGYGNAPSFVADLEVAPGQSGGPVIGPTGICGIITGSASSFMSDTKASLISMLYPLLTTKITKSLPLATNFTMNFGMPFIHLIKKNMVKTDGSESEAIIRPTEDGKWYISHKASEGHESYVFDDLDGYLKDRKAEKKLMPKIRVK